MNDRTSSHGVLRTNPKISGNVKITIDSQGNVWINSIDSTKELSGSQYKKFRVTTTSSYEGDLKSVFGKLPPEVMFHVKENKPDPDNTSQSLADQYDFFYSMGAQPLISDQYDESYSYFAPIWLKDDLPGYFVILKVDDPLDFPYNKNVPSGSISNGKEYILDGSSDFSITYNNQVYSNDQTFKGSTQTDYIIKSGTGNVVLLDENKDIPIDTAKQFKDILKKAHVIKTFDMSEGSKIGDYLRRIRNSKFFPQSPLTVRFDEDIMTTWNGVSYMDGSMTSKGEYLSDFWTDAQLQIDFEEYITRGFERQGIICPMLLNLEFLFDDDEAEMYSIPRYFGFYVNAVNTATVQLDGQALYDNRSTSGNTPSPKRPDKGFNYQPEDFYQHNDEGVRLFFTGEKEVDGSIFIPSSTTFTDFIPRIYWLQDRDKNFYSLDERGTNAYNTDKKDLVLRNKTINLGKFAGPGNVRLQSKGTKLTDKGRSYCILKIKGNLNPNDRIKLYWNLGLFSDSYGKYHILTGNDLSRRDFTVTAGGTLLTFIGMDLRDEFSLDMEIEIKYGNGNSVMKRITTTPIYASGNTTFSIDSPIDSSTTTAYTPILPGWGPGSYIASDNNDTIYYHPYGTNNELAKAITGAFNSIEARTFDAIAIEDEIVIRFRNGESASNGFFVMVVMNDYSIIQIQSATPTLTSQHFFEGGTDLAQIRLRFPLDDIDTIKNGNKIYARTKRGLCRIEFVGRYMDEPIEEIGGDDIIGLNGYSQYGAFYIDNHLDETLVGDSGFFICYDLFDIPVGLFSFFTIKDLDGDFYSSTYYRSPNLEYRRYFDIPSNTIDVLVPNRKYLVKSSAQSLTTNSISYLGNTISGTNNGTEFIAGNVSNEIIASGNGAINTFVFTALYPPLVKGSIKITDTIETIQDDGNGNLLGSLFGSGTVDYKSGKIIVNFFNSVNNGQQVSMDYQSTAGFTVLTGDPFIVAEIFYNAAIPESTSLIQGKNYSIFGAPFDLITSNAIPGTMNALPFGNQFTAVSTDSYTVVNGNPTVIDMDGFILDDDIKSFPGFWKFKDFSTVEDQNLDRNDISFQNREKFFHLDLLSEYDYLKENFTVNESVKGRLVPYINKWVYQNGSDVRDNDYRLNNNPVFGSYGFSPSFEMKTQNPEGFTHEWYYLEQPPQQYSVKDLKDNYYFFYDKLDLDKLKNTNPSSEDYFSKYFTFNPTEDSIDQERYSIFKYNPEIGLCETFFRGVKIRIKEIIRDTTQIPSNKPPFKNQSTRYDGYKFSCILRTRKETTGVVDSPVKTKMIENVHTRSITFVIDLVINDYRTLTLFDPSNLGSDASPVVKYPDKLDSFVDYLLLYSMKTKKTESTFINTSDFKIKGIDASRVADIKLSVSINPTSPSGQYAPYTLINVFPNDEYDWDMRDEVKNFDKNNGFKGSFLFGDTIFPYPLASTQTILKFGIPGTLGYPQDPTNPYPSFMAPSNIFIPFGSPSDWTGYPITQMNAGKLYLEPIMQRISFGRLAEKINDYDPIIKYLTYRWNGIASAESKDEFYIEMVEPNMIVKKSAFVPKLDDDKPEEFKNEPVIGVTHDKVGYVQQMFRYNGPYEPKFKNVLAFNIQKSDAIEIAGIDLSFKQATFNPNVEGFATVNNLNILKVSKNDVLTLAKNTKYKSRYPILNEVPIDRRNFFVFQSNWDPGYWRTYLTKEKYLNQAGTREMTETKNFLGTKIMKTPSSVRIQTFTKQELPTLDLVKVESYDGEILYSISPTKIQGLINVRKRLLRFLIEDGANKEFIKNLMPEFGVGDPDELDDDVLSYLNINVLGTYGVRTVDLYIKKYRDGSNLPSVRTDINDAQKLTEGYILDKNFTTKKIDDFTYMFEYNIDPNYSVSLSPSLTVAKI